MGTYSTMLGRIGRAYDSYCRLANDMKTGNASKYYPPDEFLDAANRCMRELAIEGYWETVTTLDLTANTTEYDLISLIPTLVQVKRIRTVSTNNEVEIVSDFSRYTALYKYLNSDEYTSGSTPLAIYISSNKMLVLPTPAATESDALIVGYSYLPPKLGGGVEITLGNSSALNRGSGTVGLVATSHGLEANEEITISGTTSYNGTFTVLSTSTTSEIRITATYVSETIPTTALCGRYYTPKWPEAFDNVLVYYALQEMGLKDSGRKNSNYQEYQRRYESAKAMLLTQGNTEQPIRIRPVR